MPRRKRQRSSSLPPGSEQAKKVDKEPMWCFEVRWSCLAEFWGVEEDSLRPEVALHGVYRTAVHPHMLLLLPI